MTRIVVPYHLDEHLPDLDAPVEADAVVTVELPDGDSWGRMAHLYDLVAENVADAVRRGDRPVVVSGDCTTSLAVVAGLQRAGVSPAIVWFDAHGDVQTLETTTSGYLGGMPLRILAGYRPELIADGLGLRPVPEDRIVLVDARDLDPPEMEYLEHSAVRRYPVGVLTAERTPDEPIYLHVDFDVVDPEELPGQLIPAPGGPSLQTVAEGLRRIMETGRVAAVGVACTWRPGAGASERAREALAAAGI
ncbi:MAG: arginase family protein [Thermoanaerobaculia bacterium]